MGFDAAVTLFGKDEEERKVSIPCNPFDFKGTGFDRTMRWPDGHTFKYSPVGKSEKGAKESPYPAALFDFRGADFDMTTDDTEGTYFKYLPFGEDEEGRKMPYKIEKDEFQRNHIRLGFGQTYARPTSVGADRQGTRTALPGRCRRGRTTANVPLRNQSAETAGGIHLPSARRPCLRTLSADLDAGALRTPHAAQDFRSRAAGRNARMPPALLRHATTLRNRMGGSRYDPARPTVRKPHARGVERSPASPHPHLRLPVPGETAPAERPQGENHGIRTLDRPDHGRQARRRYSARQRRHAPQCGTDLPTLRATFICLSLGYELVAQSGKTRRGGRSALPRNDLRPRRAQDRSRAGSLHYGRSGPHRPQSRRRTARNRTLLVPLQGRERSGRRGPHGISRYPPGHRRHNIHDRKRQQP